MAIRAVAPASFHGLMPGALWAEADRAADFETLFVGALALTPLARLELDGRDVVREEKLLDDRGWRVRDVRQGHDG